MNLLIPNFPHHISFSGALKSPDYLFLHVKLSHLSLSQSATVNPKGTVICMGGRVYPGGVSKYKWRRIQANKAKWLKKSGLSREKQLYEIRKRAEMKAAVSELERPWEVARRAPNLSSVEADEQLKMSADRFQMPGEFDLWGERDGPQLLERSDELPSAKFIQSKVVHRSKPYEKFSEYYELDGIGKSSESEVEGVVNKEEESKNAREYFLKRLRARLYDEREFGKRELLDVEDGSEEGSSCPIDYVGSSINSGLNEKKIGYNWRKNGTRKKFLSKDQHSSNRIYSSRFAAGRKQRGQNSIVHIRSGYNNRRTSGYASPKHEDSRSEFSDVTVSLQEEDG